MKRLVLLFLLLVAFSLSAQERWFTFSIGDAPVGHVHEVTNGLDTETKLVAKLKRLGSGIEMRFVTTTKESAAGDLQQLTFESMLSKQTSRLEVHVDGDQLRIAAGGHERMIPRGSNRILGPVAIARLTVEKLRSEGEFIEYSVFAPELQNVVTVRRTMRGGGTIEERMEGLPAPRMVTVDANGWLVNDSISGPFGVMTTRRATREAALAIDGGSLPEDMYERTVARSNLRIADAAAVDRIVLRIRPRDPAIGLPDFSAHNQRVIEPGLVEIRRASREGAKTTKVADEFLAANALVESTHPGIVKVARELNTTDPEVLTKWVAEHMTFDSGIVMAPASELIRDRRGTCMGYATLLASLARASGVPSRIAMGYVYYGGIWGGHAWTEMFAGGRWLPFDAAVYAPGIASATRLAAGSSSFRDGGGELMSNLGRLFSRVDIDVVEINGVRVPDGAKPYAIEGSTWTSRGLGMRVDAKDYAIEKADSTWPSTLVVAFRRGENVIELHQKSRYPKANVTADHAVFAVPEGATLWVWSSVGPDAAEALHRFLPRVSRIR